MEVEKINKKIGIDITGKEITELLSKMCLQSVIDDNEGKFVKVTIPPTRAGKQKVNVSYINHIWLFLYVTINNVFNSKLHGL